MSVIIVTGKKGSDTTEDPRALPPTVEIAVQACHPSSSKPSLGT